MYAHLRNGPEILVLSIDRKAGLDHAAPCHPRARVSAINACAAMMNITKKTESSQARERPNNCVIMNNKTPVVVPPLAASAQ